MSDDEQTDKRRSRVVGIIAMIFGLLSVLIGVLGVIRSLR